MNSLGNLKKTATGNCATRGQPSTTMRSTENREPGSAFDALTPSPQLCVVGIRSRTLSGKDVSVGRISYAKESGGVSPVLAGGCGVDCAAASWSASPGP
jgi:hypothetical protein